MSSYQETTKLTPQQQAILDKDIYVLTKICEHLKACSDPNCHMRGFLRA